MFQVQVKCPSERRNREGIPSQKEQLPVLKVVKIRADSGKGNSLETPHTQKRTNGIRATVVPVPGSLWSPLVVEPKVCEEVSLRCAAVLH